MTASGNIYNVVLNDCEERAALGGALHEAPYRAPPVAPVVTMKPLSALAGCGPLVQPDQVLIASATLALLFARDAAKCTREQAMAAVGAVALALDLSSPRPDYYRPALAQTIGEGSLALGRWQSVALPERIATFVDGAEGHGWSLDRLVRDPATLVADLSVFMTLRGGDVLLIGLPGDAPTVRAGQVVEVQAEGLEPVRVSISAAKVETA